MASEPAVARTRRPYFVAETIGSKAFMEGEVTFDWHKGTSAAVRRRSSASMMAEIERTRPRLAGKVLEVSSKAEDEELGCALSAFSLVLADEGTGESHPVENWFQAAKVFSRGGQEFGPFDELRDLSPVDAKRFVSATPPAGTAKRYADDELYRRVRAGVQGASVCAFQIGEDRFATEPKSAFYDYLYCMALAQDHNAELSARVLDYLAFQDIEFNPYDGRGRIVKYNSQARACAVFVGLTMRGTLAEALGGFNRFVATVGYR